MNIGIYEAVKGNDIEKVKNLLKNGTDVNIKDNYGWTALHEACYWGCYANYYNIVHLLLKNGADVNTRNDYRYTPLRNACCCGYYDIVNLLPPFLKEEHEGITSFNNFWRVI